MNNTDDMELMRKILLERIEKRVGRSVHTPRDFDFLSMRIFDATNLLVSVSTLKRLCGYIGEGSNMPRRSTFNILARFLGYTDWDTFCQESSAGGVAESDFVLNRHITVNPLFIGILLWYL